MTLDGQTASRLHDIHSFMLFAVSGAAASVRTGSFKENMRKFANGNNAFTVQCRGPIASSSGLACKVVCRFGHLGIASAMALPPSAPQESHSGPLWGNGPFSPYHPFCIFMLKNLSSGQKYIGQRQRFNGDGASSVRVAKASQVTANTERASKHKIPKSSF